jgi:hypothetical protein
MVVKLTRYNYNYNVYPENNAPLLLANDFGCASVHYFVPLGGRNIIPSHLRMWKCPIPMQLKKKYEE